MSNNNSQKQKYNSVPFIVFTPIEKNKKYSTFVLWLSFFLSIVILIVTLRGGISFSQETLKEMAEFTLNLVFVTSALGLTMFTLPIKIVHPDKDKIILSYIGTSILLVSISIFTYILSYCAFLNITFINSFDLFSLYFCFMIFIICRCITSISCTIVAYFNIRN